jgi:hypothetical protein
VGSYREGCELSTDRPWCWTGDLPDLVKDYDANPRLKGIGWFITLFVTGFGWGMFAYASLILHRERVVLDNEPWLEGREWKIAIRLAVLSSIWLLLVAFLAVFKFSLL